MAQGTAWRRGRRALGVALAFGLALGGTANAAYAPLNQPGPPLSVPLKKLRASLQCEHGVRDATVEPVLLSPGTGDTPEGNFSWNWEPALHALGIPWCAYTAPHHALDNIETSGEYLAYAIRTMHALAHRRVGVMGHSQGGMSMRWTLRFWPDTRAMVDDVIGLAGTNHGTTQQPPDCAAIGCPPADLQQANTSAFIRALNSDAETFARISYTEVYTHRDEVATPNTDANHCTSCLHTGHGSIANIATQDICPNDGYEHNEVGTIDPVAYAIAVDALTHRGPADPARIARSVCSQPFMPGVTQASATAGIQGILGLPGVLGVAITPLAPPVTGVQNVKAEPALACYVFARCSGPAAPTLRLSFTRRGRRIRVLVRTLEGDQLVPVSSVTVKLAGHHALTGARGRATLFVRLRPERRYRITATRTGCNPASKTVRAHTAV